MHWYSLSKDLQYLVANSMVNTWVDFNNYRRSFAPIHGYGVWTFLPRKFGRLTLDLSTLFVNFFISPNSYSDSCEGRRYLRLPAIQYSLGKPGKSQLGQVLVVHVCRPVDMKIYWISRELSALNIFIYLKRLTTSITPPTHLTISVSFNIFCIVKSVHI